MKASSSHLIAGEQKSDSVGNLPLHLCVILYLFNLLFNRAEFLTLLFI